MRLEGDVPLSMRTNPIRSNATEHNQMTQLMDMVLALQQQMNKLIGNPESNPSIQPIQAIPLVQSDTLPVQQVYNAPPVQPVYNVPPIQPVYSAPHVQPVYNAPPVQPVYNAPPVQSVHMQPIGQPSLREHRTANFRSGSMYRHENMDNPEQHPVETYPIALADSRDQKNPKVCAYGKFTRKKQKAEEWVHNYVLWANTQYINYHPSVRASRSIASFGASMGDLETQTWFVTYLQDYPQATPEELYDEFRATFMSMQERLESGSLKALSKCKQKEGESAKAFNNRFRALHGQFLEATSKGRGVYDLEGVHKAYRKNLSLENVALQILQMKDLKKMMVAAERESDRIYELLAARKEKSLVSSDEEEEEEESEDEEEVVTTKTKGDNKKEPQLRKQDPLASPVPRSMTNSLATKANTKETIKTEGAASKADLDNLTKEFKSLKIFLSKGGNNTPRPAGPALTRYSGESRDISAVKCFNCNNHGHYARDCPEPKTVHTILVELKIEKGVNENDYEVRCYNFGYVDAKLEKDFLKRVDGTTPPRRPPDPNHGERTKENMRILAVTRSASHNPSASTPYTKAPLLSRGITCPSVTSQRRKLLEKQPHRCFDRSDSPSEAVCSCSCKIII